MLVKYVYLILLIFTITGTFNSSFARADERTDLPNEYTLLEPLPCVPGNGVKCEKGTMLEKVSFDTYFQYVFNIFIAIAAAASVFMIVLGGFQYMTTDSWKGKSEGLTRAKNALLGLILVLCSYLILKTIDPRLVKIPSTLVPKLSLDKSELFDYNKFFKENRIDDLNQASEAVKARKEAENGVFVLQDKYDELSYLIDEAKNNKNEEEVAKLEAEQYGIEKEIDQQLVSMATEYAISKMYINQAIGMQEMLELSSYEARKKIDELITKINMIPLRAREELEKISNPVDAESVKKINTAVIYINASLELQKLTHPVRYEAEFFKKTVDETLNKYLTIVTDPELQLKLKNQAEFMKANGINYAKKIGK